MPIGNVKGMVALITGAASGLGRGTAKYLVEHGAKVIIADMESSKGAEFASELGEDNALFTPMNITSDDDIIRSLEAGVHKFHKLNSVVNCAGIAIASKVFDVGNKKPFLNDGFLKVHQTNVFGTFNMIRLACPYIYENEPDEDKIRGVFINTASIAAYDGQIGQAAYASSKGAIVSMTLPIARELAYCGMRVVTIAPGLFKTPLLEGLPAKIQAFLANMVPIPNRLGDPAEFASLVKHIMENPYINGDVIRIDGGIRMPP